MSTGVVGDGREGTVVSVLLSRQDISRGQEKCSHQPVHRDSTLIARRSPRSPQVTPKGDLLRTPGTTFSTAPAAVIEKPDLSFSISVDNSALPPFSSISRPTSPGLSQILSSPQTPLLVLVILSQAVSGVNAQGDGCREAGIEQGPGCRPSLYPAQPPTPGH